MQVARGGRSYHWVEGARKSIIMRCGGSAQLFQKVASRGGRKKARVEKRGKNNTYENPVEARKGGPLLIIKGCKGSGRAAQSKRKKVQRGTGSWHRGEGKQIKKKCKVFSKKVVSKIDEKEKEKRDRLRPDEGRDTNLQRSRITLARL